MKNLIITLAIFATCLTCHSQVVGGGKNYSPVVGMTNSLASGGIAFKSFSTNSFSATSFTIDKPANAAVGDIVVVPVCTDNVHTVNSLPAGFIEITNNTLGASGFGVYYKVIDGGEDPTFTFGFSASEGGTAMAILVGNVNASPIDQQGAETGASSPHTTAALTPNQPNSMLLGIIYIDPTSTPVISAGTSTFIGESTAGILGALGAAYVIQTTATSQGVSIAENIGGTWGEYTLVIKP